MGFWGFLTKVFRHSAVKTAAEAIKKMAELLYAARAASEDGKWTLLEAQDLVRKLIDVVEAVLGKGNDDKKDVPF